MNLNEKHFINEKLIYYFIPINLFIYEDCSNKVIFKTFIIIILIFIFQPKYTPYYIISIYGIMFCSVNCMNYLNYIIIV